MTLPAFIGQYRILSPLAQGGMGELFLARQEGPSGTSKTLVVKRLLPELANKRVLVEQFLEEARLVSLVRHPNVVGVYELGREGDAHFLAMEYVRGQSLRGVLKRLAPSKMPLPPRLAAGIARQALAGLAAAHALRDEAGNPLGLVHRDVSPDNLLISYTGVTKLADFGVARAMLQAGTAASQSFARGKLPYLSPEALSDKDGTGIDARADVWAVGVCLYEVLGGRRPFLADDEATLRAQILGESPPPLRELSPRVPEALAELVHRALEKDPEKRHANAAAMVEAIDGYLAIAGGFNESHLASFLKALFGPEVAAALAELEKPEEQVEPTVVAAPAPAKVEPLPPPPAVATPREDAPPPPREEVPPPPSVTPIVLGTPLPDAKAPVSAAEEKREPPRVPVRVGPPPQLIPRKSNATKNLAVAAVLLAVALVGLYFIPPLLSPPPPIAPLPPVAAKPPAPTPDPVPTTPTPTNPTEPSPPEVAVAPPEADAADAGGAVEDPTEVAALVPEAADAGATEPANETAVALVADPNQKGKVRLLVNPWAEVFFKGRSIGVTPMAPFELPPGKQRLTLKNKQLGKERQLVVLVKSGRTVQKKIDMLE